MIPIPETPGRRGAVAVVVDQGRMLVIRRSPTVVAPLAYCFPGGGIEPEETEQQALVRELGEELSLAVRPLRRLWECVTPWKVQLAWWLAAAEPGAVPRPNPAEVHSVHWMTPAEMIEAPGLLESNRRFLELVLSGRIEGLGARGEG